MELTKGLDFAKSEYDQFYTHVHELQTLESENERNAKMLKFYKKKKDLQQYVSELGFFSIFLEFVGGFPFDMTEEIEDEYEEEDELLDSLQFQKKKLS